MNPGNSRRFQTTMSADGRTHRTCEIDEAGNPIGPANVVTAEPEIIPLGLAAVAERVSRYVAAAEPRTALMIFAVDRTRGYSLSRFGERTEISLPYAHLLERPERELAARELFARHDIAPIDDVPEARASFMRYPLPGKPERAATLCRELLASCYAVAEDEPLQFTLMRYP